ncbi:MAG TPA: hypothetical protein DCZ95_07975 [Verrucomicrobia bacterium]|nr:hypothetical protein [Verrucomicrobiota bacterium]
MVFPWKQVCTVTLAALSTAAAPIESPSNWVVSRAQAWQALLGETNGWIGADGIYSISLSGYDAPGGAQNATSVFVFGDTFVGQVQSNRIGGGWRMPHNTAAVLVGGNPERGRLTYYWGSNQDGSATALFTPSTPLSKSNEWYWLHDGVAVSGRLFLTASRMTPTGEGYWGFAVTGTALLVSPPGQPLQFSQYAQFDAPLLYEPSDGRGTIVLGNAVMPNTAEAGAPFPDGYIYVYGHQNDPFNKKLVAARVPSERFGDFSHWRYWNGASWGTNLADAAVLTDRISSEFSVTPLTNGSYALIFQKDTLSADTAVRIGESPIGPFGPLIVLWTAPEVADPSLGTNILTYNAKAHPHLSAPGEWLITYNVGSTSGSEALSNAAVTRPRFIRARLEGLRFESIGSPSNAELLLQWPGDDDGSYRLEFSEQVSGTTWSALTNVACPTGHLVSIRQASPYPAGFYRLQKLPK